MTNLYRLPTGPKPAATVRIDPSIKALIDEARYLARATLQECGGDRSQFETIFPAVLQLRQAETIAEAIGDLAAEMQNQTEAKSTPKPKRERKKKALPEITID